jgi:hypothetical protein
MSLHPLRLAAICAAALLVGVPVRAQSLGDLAKKTQEQRDKAKADAGAKKPEDAEKDKKEKKVFTDQDLKTLQPIAGGTAPAPAAGAPAAADAADAKADDALTAATKGEAYWRARWMPVAERITKGEAEAAATRKHVDEMTFQLRSLGKLADQRDTMLVERQRLIALEKELTAQVADDKAALARIQEEGRQAGALPGWFR